jgi:hypothetical protein
MEAPMSLSIAAFPRRSLDPCLPLAPVSGPCNLTVHYGIRQPCDLRLHFTDRLH